MKTIQQTPEYSVVIPVFNEAETVQLLYERLTKVFAAISPFYEFVFIDDGSYDNSIHLLRALHLQDQRVKIVSFSRNFGHQVAINAGLHHVSGKAIIVMDGDLQDPPEVIPKFIEQWKNGAQVAYAIRKNRKETFLKRKAYQLFYRLLKVLSNIDIPLDAGDFCLMDQQIVALMNKMPERQRFIRGLRSWVGFRQVGVAFDRDERFSGNPKYTLGKLLHLAFDGIFSFSESPLKLATVIGLFVSCACLCFALYVIINYIFSTTPYFINSKPGWASLIVSITFLGGVQLISIGILGEYVGRVFGEVKQRLPYVVGEFIGLDERDQ